MGGLACQVSADVGLSDNGIATTPSPNACALRCNSFTSERALHAAFCATGQQRRSLSHLSKCAADPQRATARPTSSHRPRPQRCQSPLPWQHLVWQKCKGPARQQGQMKRGRSCCSICVCKHDFAWKIPLGSRCQLRCMHPACLSPHIDSPNSVAHTQCALTWHASHNGRLRGPIATIAPANPEP
jgi:hypothetical protein